MGLKPNCPQNFLSIGLPVAARLLATLLFVCCAPPVLAQYVAPYVAVTGTMSSANGIPAANYSLSFQPTQVMFVGGSSVVVANSNCATDANGAVVGVRNPLQGPVVNANLATGTVPAGNYYVEITWYDTYAHQTLPSPEIQVQLTTAGSIVVSPPAGGVAINTIGMNVYIGTTSGGETYQGQTVTPTATYTRSTAVAVGAALPILNGTVCQVVANDAAWPIAGYNATLANASGNTVPGYPQQWQFLGPGSTYNLSNGIPLYNGRVTYPAPILTLPYNHNPQAISGALSLSNYNLYNVGRVGVGTALPAWGVDVEGTGVAGEINAANGYLVNGSGGTAKQCLGSTGTVYGIGINCGNYQTVQAAGATQPQETILNLGSGFTVTDDPTNNRTTVTVNGAGPTVQLSLPATTILSNSCSSTATVAMTGVSSTSTFSTAFATNPTAATGWGANGGLVVELWPDASPNVLDWAICNQTASSITPTAIVLNVGLL